MIDPDESRPPHDGLFDEKSPEDDVRAPTPLERDGAVIPSDPDAATAEALRHLALVAATLMGMVVMAYVVPQLHGYAPWRPGDPPPLHALFDEQPEIIPGFAGTGNEGAGVGDEDSL